MRNLLTTLAVSSLAVFSHAAQATPPEQWVIIEGHGLTDDAVYLGQPRKQLVQRSKTCKKPATECSFRIAPSVQDITVYFNAKNKVDRIRFASEQVFFNCSTQGPAFTWPTSRGSQFFNRFYQVESNYPGSTVQCGGGVCAVDAPAYGLRFEDRHRFEDCFDAYNGTFEITAKKP